MDEKIKSTRCYLKDKTREMNIRNNKAFSFVEALITVLISTVVFAGIYSTYIVGNKAWVHYSDSITARREVRRALLGMANELRAAKNVRVIQGPDGSAIHFYSSSVGPVSFVWNRKGKDGNRIIRYNRLSKRILAQHITALSFKDQNDAVIINVMASKQTTKGQVSRAVLKEKVALRSKTKFFE